ncbi:flagella biosynthesis regulator Flk [Biostraticola tofi]|uniref:Fluke n=1 Tax=Biostraticola tofi TaxID=466109 RepID=A0A4R3Z3G2_9GAMM|nr:flagella biosynthesis regulator Flk [Biostraticola tofi]TCW00354.1 hypothetical protein EDC52_101703 [Biostraticola tofi]
MQPVKGPGTPANGVPPRNPTAAALPGQPPRGPAVAPPTISGGDAPLTSVQRTSLERMVIRIMALTNSKAVEIWAALRHQLGIPVEGELTASHFQPALQLLQTRLDLARDTHAGRQLMQQLSELLTQGNNRQAVSDYIRQQFGHTVLSQLTAAELRQVVTLLQAGNLAIPHPQQAALTDRTLLPAEHHALNQQITRLAAATGESPATLWQSLLAMMGLKAGDPIPARHFTLLMQFLQGHVTLAQQASPTLATILAVLKQPTNRNEQQAVEAYCQQHFNAGIAIPLSSTQVSAVMQFLFIYRLTRTQSQHQTPDARLLQPATSPLIDTGQPHPAQRKPPALWLAALIVAVAAALLALLI